MLPREYKTENQYGEGTVVSWASLLDVNCLQQAQAISRAPAVAGYVALMPDAHFGFGPPVGSAIMTKDAVMPYAVGVDIGCGMIAVETDLVRRDFVGHETAVLAGIREGIPAGVGQGHGESTRLGRQFLRDYGPPPGATAESEFLTQGKSLTDTALRQFGTLGSGNHFVEVAEDTLGTVWLVLHSGSRGVGNRLAQTHVKKAQAHAVAKGERLESKEFAYFTRDYGYYEYIADMQWAQAYAREQREAMMLALIRAVEAEVGEFSPLRWINCHHNYAEDQGGGVWLTRKGAIDASLGVFGVIPGSMGAATYIVQGLGNAAAYNTAPHGAGRLLGRGAAKRSLDVDEFKASMAGKTWLDRDADALLDEAPLAYKPIETVIEDSKTLVTTVAVLSQFINYKGV